MALVSPIARSKVSLMPWDECEAESQFPLPLLDEGTKQMRWSPESAAVNVKRPAEAPFCEITRWSLSKISYALLLVKYVTSLGKRV